MDMSWLVIFIPLAIPSLSACAGGIIGGFTVAKKTFSRMGLFFLYTLAVISALIPNMGQTLRDIGVPRWEMERFPFLEIEPIQIGSYFALIFCIFGFYKHIKRKWTKAIILSVLLLVAFFEPLKWSFAHIIWHFRGFAP